MADSSRNSLRESLVGLSNWTSEVALIKDALFKMLYFGLSKEGQFLYTLFPNSDQAHLPKTYSQITQRVPSLNEQKQTQFYDSSENLRDIPDHTGRTCSRKFRTGEPIYRCDDCGFDETCVLCSYCYNPQDHENHQISVSIASDRNEGICDCGDPEAWNVPLNCKCSVDRKSDEIESKDAPLEVPEDLKLAMAMLLEVAVDLFIEVFIHQNHTIPAVHDSFKSSYNLETKLVDASELINDGISTNTAEYCLILWNDEFHNYPDATSRILAVLNSSHQQSERVAVEVDKVGRTILKKSANLKDLVSAYYVVQRTGLTLTIQSLRDVMKQEVAGAVVSWLDHLLNFPVPEVQSALRELYRQVILAKFDYQSLKKPYFLVGNEYEINHERHAFTEGLLMDDNALPRGGLTKFAQEVYDVESLKSPLKKFLEEDYEEQMHHSRFQYLLYLEIRMWKQLRKALHNVLTPMIVANLEYKPLFADHFVQIFPHLFNNRANLDREWLLNVLNESTVQLFTCPKTSLRILKHGHLIKVLSPIIEVFEKNRSITTNAGEILWKKRDVVSQADYHGRAITFTQRRCLTDLIQLIEHPSFTVDHLCVLETRNFVPLILLIKRFQSNWKIKRKEGEHVQTESYEFSLYFDFNSRIYELIRALGKIVLKSVNEFTTTHFQTVENAIVLLNNFLQLQNCKEKWIDQGFFNIIDFKVAKRDVGFMNPLNSLLSQLIESLKITNFKVLDVKVTNFTVDEIHKTSNPTYTDFLRVSDVSLRALALCSQIKVGFWVRNGVLVGRQEALYSGSFAGETGYKRDIHLQQVSVIVEPSKKRSFFNLLDRFDLLDWFFNNQDVDHTAYEERIYYIFEEFISLLYHIYVSRLSFKVDLSEQEKEDLLIRKMICYCLCQGPLAYSQITENLPLEIVSHPQFETLLSEISDYTPPQGLNDRGLYRLKTRHIKQLDPLSSFIEVSDISETSNAIKQALAHQSKKKVDDIVLLPELMDLTANLEILDDFKKIDDFMRSQQVAKLLYKLLQTAIDTDNESFMPVLLHLIHAIVLEEQFETDPQKALKSFIDIPIGNLLMTISEFTTMAKANANKAAHILNLMVSKSEAILQTLNDCFGEAQVAAYKEKRMHGTPGSETKEEKTKRLAKERLEKIKKRFQKQQSKFAQKNSSDLLKKPSTDADGDVRMDNSGDPKPDADENTCILCQMPQNSDDLFGYPCFVNRTAIFWQLPLHEEASCKLALSDWSDQKLIDDEELSYGKHIVEDIQNRKRKRTDSRGSYLDELAPEHHVHDSDEVIVEEDSEEEVFHELVHDDDEDEEEDDDDYEGYDSLLEDPEDIDPFEEGPVEIHLDGFDQHSSSNSSRRPSLSTDFNKRFGPGVSRRFVISSCNHAMHHSCFNQYVRKSYSFELGFHCPLCRSLNNFFLPTFPKSNAEFNFKDLFKTSDPAPTKYNQLLAEDEQENCKKFKRAFIDDAVLKYFDNATIEAVKISEDLSKVLSENVICKSVYDGSSAYFNQLQTLSILLGNTIQMYEISSRFATKSEDFLSIEVPDNNRELALSLIQTRSLLEYENSVDLNDNYHRFWQEEFQDIGIFTEFIVLVHQCEQPIDRILRVMTTKLFVIILSSLLQRCMVDESFKSLLMIVGDDFAQDENVADLSKLRRLILEEAVPACQISDEIKHLVAEYDYKKRNKKTVLCNSFLLGLNEAMKRLLLPFFRQLYIYVKILDPTLELEEVDPSKGELIQTQIEQVCALVGVESFFKLPHVLTTDHKSLEFNICDNLMRSKIPKFLTDGVLALDYPGLIKVIDLPLKLDKFLNLTPPSSTATTVTGSMQSQYCLCLLCGTKVVLGNSTTLSHKTIRHFHKDCSKAASELCLFFNPLSNHLTIVIRSQPLEFNNASRRYQVGQIFKYTLPSPYLNKHGEANFSGGSFNATLSESRYSELNRIWLNQGIYAFLGRLASVTAFDLPDPLDALGVAMNADRFGEDTMW